MVCDESDKRERNHAARKLYFVGLLLQLLLRSHIKKTFRIDSFGRLLSGIRKLISLGVEKNKLSVAVIYDLDQGVI